MATEGVALAWWVIYLLWVRIKLFYLPHFCMAVPIPHGLNITTSTETLGGRQYTAWDFFIIINNIRPAAIPKWVGLWSELLNCHPADCISILCTNRQLYDQCKLLNYNADTVIGRIHLPPNKTLTGP